MIKYQVDIGNGFTNAQFVSRSGDLACFTLHGTGSDSEYGATYQVDLTDTSAVRLV